MPPEALPGNRLKGCSSPYLQQHAHNPVAWQPWDEEALRLARDLDRPILLSIGYSACHWCHVMAHESFEDPAIAELVNRDFVPVKVDREERPDLDQIYQLAHQLMNRRGGGWPLTAFLSPDQKPFFLATYFPPEPRFGLPGFGEVLEKVADFYRESRDAAGRNGEAVIEGLGHLAPAGTGPLDRQVVDRLRGDLEGDYDPVHGGWGDAPKFPHAGEIRFCLRRGGRDGDEGARRMGLQSLRAITEGGLYDHLGGGFFRYCVDANWSIPHFEKMLYDNALLLEALADGAALTGGDRFRETAAETADWLEREMRHPEGGLFATLDADSEGMEGGYYIWRYDEVARLLEPDELAVAARVFGITPEGNFQGTSHLKRVESPATAAEALGMPPAETEARLASARSKLLSARGARAFPGRDEKILTAWNGLAVGGLARAAKVFAEPRYTRLAAEIAGFLRENLWDGERLAAVHKDGQSHQKAFLEDHAFLLNGLLEGLQADWSTPDLAFARGLADALLSQFEDPDQGGFFMTAHDHEPLIHRPKPGLDQSLPSGNGAAAWGLLELGHLLGEPRYLEAAERTLRLFLPEMRAHPGAHVALIEALDLALDPPALILLREEKEGGAADWQRSLQEGLHPGRRVYRIPSEAGDLPPALARREARAEATAYLCQGSECSAPVTDPEALEKLLAERGV